MKKRSRAIPAFTMTLRSATRPSKRQRTDTGFRNVFNDENDNNNQPDDEILAQQTRLMSLLNDPTTSQSNHILEIENEMNGASTPVQPIEPPQNNVTATNNNAPTPIITAAITTAAEEKTDANNVNDPQTASNNVNIDPNIIQSALDRANQRHQQQQTNPHFSFNNQPNAPQLPQQNDANNPQWSAISLLLESQARLIDTLTAQQQQPINNNLLNRSEYLFNRTASNAAHDTAGIELLHWIKSHDPIGYEKARVAIATNRAHQANKTKAPATKTHLLADDAGTVLIFVCWWIFNKESIAKSAFADYKTSLNIYLDKLNSGTLTHEQSIQFTQNAFDFTQSVIDEFSDIPILLNHVADTFSFARMHQLPGYLSLISGKLLRAKFCGKLSDKYLESGINKSINVNYVEKLINDSYKPKSITNNNNNSNNNNNNNRTNNIRFGSRKPKCRFLDTPNGCFAKSPSHFQNFWHPQPTNKQQPIAATPTAPNASKAAGNATAPTIKPKVT